MTGGSFGWLTLVFKRMALGFKIHGFCKKKGYKLIKNKPFWWTGRNKSGRWNFKIVTPEKSYCVKIIGVRCKRILYGFVDKNEYEIKDYTFALAHTMDSFEYASRNKKPYEFEEGSIPCVIMHPESVKVTVRTNPPKRDRIEIGNGDTTPEGIFYNLKGFMRMLDK